MPDETIEWPSVFPVLSQEYSFEPQDATLRSRMDSGYIRQRGRFTVDLKTLTVGWDFDDTYCRYFESWFKAYLAMGSGWFNMPVALGGGLTTQKVRFVGSYQAKYKQADFWEITARLEVIDSVGLDAAMLSLLMNPAFLAEFDAGLEDAINTDYHVLIHDTFRVKLAL